MTLNQWKARVRHFIVGTARRTGRPQSVLASECGMSTSSMNRLKNCMNAPTLSDLTKLAQLEDMKTWEFVRYLEKGSRVPEDSSACEEVRRFAWLETFPDMPWLKPMLGALLKMDDGTRRALIDKVLNEPEFVRFVSRSKKIIEFTYVPAFKSS